MRFGLSRGEIKMGGDIVVSSILLEEQEENYIDLSPLRGLREEEEVRIFPHPRE